MVEEITVGCLKKILIDGEIYKEPIFLQVIDLKQHEDSISLKLSDTVNVILLENLKVAKLSDFELNGIVRISNYNLQDAKDESSKFIFREVSFTAIYRNIEKIIGQPVCFGSGVQQNDLSNASTSADLSYLDFQDHALQSTSVLNSTFPPSMSEKKERLDWKREYLKRMNERAGKIRLARTKLLMQKRIIDEKLKKNENDLTEIVKRIESIHELVNEVDAKLKEVEARSADCRESIIFYSKN